ncbi:MAG TPA: hypothetical protein VN915_17285 [Elusimicrobiota bacterium]|nr:hypothetical protein [Elusimicrobiota bacterium]
MKRTLGAGLWLGLLCAASLTAGISPARAQDWNRRPDGRDGDRRDRDWHDGDRRDGDGWQVQLGDPADADCETWEFTAQTPSVKTEKLFSQGRECANFPDESGTMRNYCRPTGKMYSRNVTVSIGARALQPWEKEELKVCLDQFGLASIDASGMAYEYATASKDSNPFLGTASTVFTLTPGAKKPAAVSSDELTVTSASAAKVVLADGRADYYKGEKISISVDGMLIPVLTPGMPVDDLLKSFANFKASQTFDTAPSYELPISGATKPGKYVLTITFSRQGPKSTSATASTIATFTLP